MITFLTTVNKTQVAAVAHPAAPEPFLLVDIAFVGVVVPLGVVQKGCTANHINRDARKYRNKRSPGSSRSDTTTD